MGAEVRLLALLLTVLGGYLDLIVSTTTASARVERSVPPIHGASNNDWGHLQGVVRLRRLFCRTRFHLQINADGKVNGTRDDTAPNALLEMKAVDAGIVIIKGVKSGLYLAMNKRGKVYGSKKLRDNCKWYEIIEDNNFNTYSSVQHPKKRHRKGKEVKWFLSIAKNGRPRRGKKTKNTQRSAHFLPRHKSGRSRRRRDGMSRAQKRGKKQKN
ncbi:PREDICTED: fibroblast growth factor 22-like [Branchiostoma belcheri]|uniref:Fibroblast growth factor n=1 Tax=Branchiostoma belcheri TaxID=7741 RepID=A0A6P4ZXM1_BRABE|nr:PREDICTED: fibroblast growth factor 22-like [Branchiostoma belcheri]KAI8501423.1 Fibroblast growth factor 3 [Branchiostoma belcheri]